MSARARRIENEWKAFDALAAANAGRVQRTGATNTIVLRDVPRYGGSGDFPLRIEFPEYYPSVPLEAYVDPAVRHPNVHPETGFICLWESHHAGTAIIEAILQTMRVVTWHLANHREEHVMQTLPPMPPLDYSPLVVPADYYLSRTGQELPGPRRVRLSKIA